MTPFNRPDFRNAGLLRTRSLAARLNAGTPLQKAGVVAGGYALGLVMAAAAVIACAALERALYPQMSDNCMDVVIYFLVFGGVFTVATIPSACGGFYFLRRAAGFWRIFAWAALVFGGISVASLAVFLVRPWAWAAVDASILSVLLAPVAALGFLLGAVFSPARAARRILLAAVAMEAMAFGGWFISAATTAAAGRM